MPIFTTHDDCKIHYEIYPNVLPETTLFIHGNMSSTRWWHQLRDVISVANQPGHLILIDLRGFGQSQIPSQTTITVDQFCDDNLGLINANQWGKINLVGHSTGGLVAAVMLARQPELFNKVVMLDPVAADGIPLHEERRQAFMQMLTNPAITAMAMAAVIHGIDPQSDYFKNVIFADAQRTVASGLSVFENLAQINYLEVLIAAKNKNKVLVLHGDLDIFLSIGSSKQLAELLHGEFKEIKNHGHSLNVEDPQLFANLIQPFLFGAADSGVLSR